jgi:hypothetical protein
VNRVERSLTNREVFVQNSCRAVGAGPTPARLGRPKKAGKLLTSVRFASLALIASLLSATGLAADARVTLLTRQLANTKDPRVRAQTVLLLAQTQSAEAVAPLCASLKDPESIVRGAAAAALGDLHTDPALQCLQSALGEKDSGVRAAIEKALAPAPAESASGGLYLNLEPVADNGVGVDSNLLTLAHTVLRTQLTELGATFAPPGEEKKAAQAVIKSKALRGYQVKMQLSPGATEKQLKVEMLILSYPERALQGSWNVKASGGKPESLIKVMVPKVVQDAAGDLNWKQ